MSLNVGHAAYCLFFERWQRGRRCVFAAATSLVARAGPLATAAHQVGLWLYMGTDAVQGDAQNH
jgi:hypothetical protein